MGLLDFFRSQPEQASQRIEPRADIGGIMFDSLDDPYLLQFMRDGSATKSGVSVNRRSVLCNTAVLRSVSLISNSIGMLPMHLIDAATKEKATKHPLFRLLHRRPNSFQSAFDFRSFLQMQALTEKRGGFALVIRNGDRIVELIPLESCRVEPVQNNDWSVTYWYDRPKAGRIPYKSRDILHLRGITYDGINGICLVDQAKEAIGLALAADLAIARYFRNGSFIDGTLNAPKDAKISEQALNRMRDSWQARYSGADNAGKTPFLEEGVEYKQHSSSARDAQSNETRARQVEEIARVFGIPRPLLMVDETSWGSGIGVLGQFFVRYGLNPWFEAWQQAIERTLLSDDDQEKYIVKFNAGALLRGSMAEQGDFLAKMMGAGGQQPIFTANEARDFLDMPSHPDGDSLSNQMMGHNGGPPLNDNESGNAKP
ncbi:phage portal protein [uncultured Bradyrhizobium sp.]|uniref:phage portal protein n=1 Tax=uncultured Bradyrhizobium sp. TaxID=199684 RepID=UPI0035CBA039